MDKNKFPSEPYYPWLVLPWNAFDDEDEDEESPCLSTLKGEGRKYD